jgi:VIT1/CCC1 family predicted Fe2+/Mn2+ transporter
MILHHDSHPEPHGDDITGRLNWLRASVLGANDGVISMAALLVGVATASATTHMLLLTGTAGILAGALSMAVGEYVSVSSQRDTERALLEKERYELANFHDAELEELTMLYEQKGLKRETAEKVAEELTAHDAFAAHVDIELGIDPDNLTNPAQAGIASAISYTIGGIIPFVAILLPSPAMRVPVTFFAVLIALIITGILSARVSGARALTVTLRTVLGGALAMAVTSGIGHVFDVVVH